MVKIGDKFLIVDEDDPRYIGKIGKVGKICDDFFTFFLDNSPYSDHNLNTLKYDGTNDYHWITIVPLCPAIKIIYGENNEV